MSHTNKNKHNNKSRQLEGHDHDEHHRHDTDNDDSLLLYIMVVGFHHKKGCQVEFVYPVDDRRIQQRSSPQPTTTTTTTASEADSTSSGGSGSVGGGGDLYVLPKRWRHLPSLALPDGSHNYTTDYIYFHLEDDDQDYEDHHHHHHHHHHDEKIMMDESDLKICDDASTKAARATAASSSSSSSNVGGDKRPRPTIFGVSCYRQINASEMINKEVDVTRNTLQKSVCILARQPVYASLRLKLHSITSAYFEQKDFRRTQLLVSAFENLRKSYPAYTNRRLVDQHKLLSSPSTPPSAIAAAVKNINLIDDERSKYLVGLSLGDLVLRYQHKILVLFKLLLLQKKCLFQLKPVSNLSNTIMALVSLVPDMFSPTSDSVSLSPSSSSSSASSSTAVGLQYAAGFFDSIDLINSELERKNRNRRKAAHSDPNSLFNNEEKLKKSRKKFMSFSKRKQQHYQQRQYLKKQSQYQQQAAAAAAAAGGGAASSNSAASISSSYSSHSLKSPTTATATATSNAPGGPSSVVTPAATATTTAITSQLPSHPAPLDMSVQSGMAAAGAFDEPKSSPSLFNMISSGTQRLFSFQSPQTPTSRLMTMPQSLESDTDLYNKLGNDDDDLVVIGRGGRGGSVSGVGAGASGGGGGSSASGGTVGRKQAQLTLDLNDADLQQSDFIVGANRSGSIESPVGTVSELIKSKVSDVFKLVDWSSPLQQTQQQSPIANNNNTSNNTTTATFSTPDSAGGGGSSSSTNSSSTNPMRRSESSSMSSSRTATNLNRSGGGVTTTTTTTGFDDSPQTPTSVATRTQSLKRHHHHHHHRHNNNNHNNNHQMSPEDSNNNNANSNGTTAPASQDIQLAELLDHPFGMPLPLFNEFNILHPYLSLYYLDYFTAINKMNTKLFCTTTLMMSMMKSAASQPNIVKQQQQQQQDTDDKTATTTTAVEDSGISSATTSELSFDPTRPKQADVNNPLGYTIGATNVLFKQRLYDDLDAFIDETDVDIRGAGSGSGASSSSSSSGGNNSGNEGLRKQLQLTTADLRFADYIIKNVQTMREKLAQQTNNGNSGTSGKHGAGGGSSVRKTTSMNTFNPNTSSLTNPDGSFNAIDDEIAAQAAVAAMDFEGSDDWIRLNFKWYLYTLLASIVKEDLCSRLKCELESMLFSWAGATSSASDTSQSGGDNSSAGSCSLDNEVVANVDEYVSHQHHHRRQHRKSSGGTGGDGEVPAKHDTLTPRKKGSKKDSRKNSSSSSNGSLSSLHYFNMLQQINAYSNYRDDFNSNFITEFKRTECFRHWQETNRSRIEKSLLNFNPEAVATAAAAAGVTVTASSSSTSTTTTTATPTSPTSKSIPLTANIVDNTVPTSTTATTVPAVSNHPSWNSSHFQALLTQLQEVEQRRLTHPFNGQLGMSDIRLRFNFLFSNSESGRKLNRAFEEGSKLVNTTGKAVGNVFNSAKSTFSSFLNTWSSSSASSSPSSSSKSTKANVVNTKM